MNKSGFACLSVCGSGVTLMLRIYCASECNFHLNCTVEYEKPRMLLIYPVMERKCLFSRDRIVVSTLRCGRNNPGSNPGHGIFWGVEDVKIYHRLRYKSDKSDHFLS